MDTSPHSLPPLSFLVVEDDKVALEALRLMLTMKFPGATVYPAENGSLGLELFRKHTADIVITDINMPVMNGMEMAEQIKSIKLDTKIIVLTAYNEKVFFEKFRVIGCNAFMLKPVEFRKLFTAIEKCINEITPKLRD